MAMRLLSRAAQTPSWRSYPRNRTSGGKLSDRLFVMDIEVLARWLGTNIWIAVGLVVVYAASRSMHCSISIRVVRRIKAHGLEDDGSAGAGLCAARPTRK
jgi:hypothetical protein